MFYKKGFTLIELALILVILGILLSGGIGMISILVKNQKFNETKAIVNKACKSIEGYAVSHKKLPPDINSLGISTKDAYSNVLNYAFASNMDILDFCNNEPSNWIKLDDNGVVKDIAFIVYSKGANMHDETKTGTNQYQIKVYGTKINSYEYDDIICYGDINILREKACQAFEITTDALPEGIQYKPYPSIEFQISGGVLDDCSYSGDLPNGIIFDSTNCSISGTPIESGVFNFSITATDRIGRQANKFFSLTINPNPVKITTPYLPFGYKNNSYSVGLSAMGGTGSYSWSINSGTLPAGVSFSNGLFSGTPTETGTFNLTISACDSNYSTVCDSKTFSLTIL
jgi:prepilin-type N-terminal cleavage/methylation domain-containing protein